MKVNTNKLFFVRLILNVIIIGASCWFFNLILIKTHLSSIYQQILLKLFSNSESSLSIHSLPFGFSFSLIVLSFFCNIKQKLISIAFFAMVFIYFLIAYIALHYFSGSIYYEAIRVSITNRLIVLLPLLYIYLQYYFYPLVNSYNLDNTHAFLSFVKKFIVIYFCFIFIIEPITRFLLFNSESNYYSFLMGATSFFLTLTGFENTHNLDVLFINGSNGIRLGYGCLGIRLMGLFASFIFALDTKIYIRIFYVLFGILIIHIINIMRLYILAISIKFWPDYFYVNHHIFFKYAVYLLTFVLWWIYIRCFSTLRQIENR